jgi:hypothetical protein
MSVVTIIASPTFCPACAPIEVTVLFHELKGVGRPVFATRFNDVQVSDEQDRFFLSAASKARHHVFLAIVRSEDLHVGGREPCVKQTFRHSLGGGGYISNRVSGIDFDQFFENVVRQLLRGVVDLRRGRESEEQTWDQEK